MREEKTLFSSDFLISMVRIGLTLLEISLQAREFIICSAIDCLIPYKLLY